MKRKLTLTLILTALVCLLLSVSASAATVASGTCGASGSNLTWVLDDQGMLTISGSGAMTSRYSYSYDYPWYTRGHLIKSVTIGNNVTTIGSHAFDDCDALKSVTIGNSVTVIGSHTFYDCNALESVVIPNSVETIDTFAFSGCDALKSINIGGSVKVIGEGAFWNCIALEAVAIGDGVTTIGESAFRNCDSLESVTISDSVKTIGNYAFYDCDALESVAIPDRVTTIGSCAFTFCSDLESIAVSSDNPSYCSGDGVLFRKDMTTLIHYPAAKVGKSYTIPDSVKTIDSHAFCYCSNLTAIIFTGNAPTIGGNSFNGVTAAVFYPSSDATWTEASCQNYGGTLTWAQPAYGILDSGLVWELEPDGTLTFYGKGDISDFAYWGTNVAPWNRCVRKVVFSEGITAIGSSVFAYCDALESVVIPDSVETIGGSAFRDCSALESVVIPDSVTAIGGGAFYNCSALESVVIGDSVESIGNLAFGWNFSLRKVVFTGNAPTINSSAFTLVTATAAYPADDATWTEVARQNYDGTLTWVATTFPGFVPPPTDVCDYIGENASFSVWAVGDNLTYQWQCRKPGGSWFKSTASGADTDTVTVSVSAARDGYQYRCVVTDKNGKKATSNAATLTVAPAVAITKQPGSFAGAVGDIASFTVTAQGLGLTYQWQQRIPASANWTNVTGSEDTLTVPITAARNGYQFRCVITDKRGVEITSEAVTLHLTAPTLTVTLNTKDKPYLKWTAVEGAKKYNIYRAEKGGSYEFLYSTVASRLYMNNTNAEPGKTYYYKVCIVANGVEGTLSGYKSIKVPVAAVTFPAPGSLTVTLNSKDKPYLKWTAVEGAEGYNIYRAEKGGSYEFLYSTAASRLYMNNTNAEPGKTYYYKVCAVANGTEGTLSGYKSIKVPAAAVILPAPGSLTITLNSKDKPYLKWSAVDGAEGYNIYRAEKGGSYEFLYSTSASRLYMNNTSAEPGKTYYYKVCAVANGVEGALSGYKSVKVPA